MERLLRCLGAREVRCHEKELIELRSKVSSGIVLLYYCTIVPLYYSGDSTCGSTNSGGG